MEITGGNIDEILNRAIQQVMENGREVSPRNYLVKEILGVKLVLTNPRNRIYYNPKRKLRIPFSIGEFLWYYRGASDCDLIQYYNRRYGEYSDDGKVLNGAYGKRIFGPNREESQWNTVYNLMKKDIDTRQAVITICQPNDIRINTKDVPCTNTIQYFVREGRLDCIVYMRSNDLIWGTPYDIFSFTMLQEIMAKELGVELGKYIHTVGSMHIYSRHYELANEIIKLPNYTKYGMPPMPNNISEDILLLLKVEQDIRLKEQVKELPKTQYCMDLLSILNKHSKGKYEYSFTDKELVVPDYLNL